MKLRSCILSPQFFLLQELSADQQNMSFWSQKYNVLVQNVAHYEIISQKNMTLHCSWFTRPNLLTDRFLLPFQWRHPSKWVQYVVIDFYCAMHYSAKRMSSVCPSVCLSVCDIGGLWSHRPRLEILEIAQTISQTPSLLVTQRPSTYSQENMGEIWGTLEVGWGKSGVLEHKIGNISQNRKLEEKLLWRP